MLLGGPEEVCRKPVFWGDEVDVLSGVGSVVHHQEFDILDIVNKERLVARGHHVTSLLVGPETDL